MRTLFLFNLLIFRGLQLGTVFFFWNCAGGCGDDGGAKGAGDACRIDIFLFFHGGDCRLDSRH